MPDETDVAAPAAPPAWNEVESHPDYQSQSPAEKLVTFSRWHDQAYNFAKTLPDWSKNANEFNTQMADQQSALSKAAGNVSPDEARVQVAKSAIADVSSRDEQRNTLRDLGPDIYKSYFQSLAPDTSVVHQILNGVREFGSTVGSGIENTIAGLAEKSAQENEHPGLVERAIQSILPDGLRATSEENRQQAADVLHQSALYWQQRAANAGKESAVDPKLEDTMGAQASRFLGNTGLVLGESAIPGAGPGIVLAQNGLQRYGEVMNQTGDADKAQSAMNRSILGNMLFMGVGEGVNMGLDKVIPQGANAIREWVSRTSAAFGGNVAVGQLQKAAESAADAPEGKRMEAFTTALSDLSPTDAATALGFAVHAGFHERAGAHPIEQQGRDLADAIRNEAETTATAAEPTAPQTAEAVRQTAATDAATVETQSKQEAAVATAEEAPQISLSSRFDPASRATEHTLNVTEAATPEQLQTFSQEVDGMDHLPAKEKQAIKDQITAELTKRGVTPTTPPAEPAAPEQPAAPTLPEGVTVPEGVRADGMMDLGPNRKAFTFTETDPTSPSFGGTFAVPEADLTSENIAARRAEQRARFENPELEAKKAEFEARKAQRTTATPEPTETAQPETPATPEPEAPQPTAPATNGLTEHAAPEVFTQRAVEAGLTPSMAEIRKATGLRGTEARDLLNNIEAGVRTAYPAETLAEGETEVQPTENKKLDLAAQGRHPLTGDFLPKVQSADGKIRAMFTNDPEITAQQIDVGDATTDKAKRLYIPDEIFDEDKVNPAIHFAYDKEAGKYYVTGADSEVGHVDRPRDLPSDEKGTSYTEARNARDAFKKAHAPVLLDPEKLIAVNEEVQSQMGKRNMADDVVSEAEALENGSLEDAETAEDHADALTRASGKEPSPITVQQNFSLLDKLGLTPKGPKSLGPDPINRSLKAIAESNSFSQPQRLLARLFLDSGLDTSKLKLTFTNDPTRSAGLYSLNSNDVLAGKIALNLGVDHVGGIPTTLLHEVVHHATFAKLSPEYKRTVVEEAAYNRLQKILDHAKTQLSNEHGARDVYGLKNVHEFVAETLSNPRFQSVLSQMKATPEIAKGGTFRNMLEAVSRTIKQLVTGKTVSKGSLLDQALDESIRISTSGTPSTERYVRGVQEANSAESKAATRMSRGELERAYAERYPDGPNPSVFETGELREALSQEKSTVKDFADAVAIMSSSELKSAVLAQDPSAADSIDTWSKDEMRDFLTRTSTVTDSGKIDDSGWLTPQGDFISAPNGNHYRAALGEVANHNPELGRSLEREQEKLGREMTLNELYDFMDKRGYTRVVHGGNEIYATASRALSNSHQRLLRDAAMEQSAALIHDTGERSRTLYQPANAEAAAAGPPKARIVSQTLPGGKQTHTLQIDPTADRSDLLQVLNSLQHAPIPAAAKLKIGQQLQLQLGPTMTLRSGKDRVQYGYDSANNIANRNARQAANSVALDFGKAWNPSKEALADRAAMPFVVEAGGNREELVHDLNRVANSKNPELREKFTPVVQHALDNFERLNGKADNYNRMMKEQLAREKAYGIKVGELENYVTRLLDLPESKTDVIGQVGGQGTGRYFTKGRAFEKLSDAIEAGYSPRSEGKADPTDIVALTQHRVEAGERLVQHKILEDALRTTKATDGRPIIGDQEEFESYLGGKEMRPPRGYITIQTGAKPLLIHPEYVPLFKALYGDSSFPHILNTVAGTLKRNTLVFDTYHVGRIMFKELAYSKGANRFGYGKGLSLLEFSPEDLDRAVKSGDITQTMADYANEKVYGDMTRREIAEKLMEKGLNVGKVSDNLTAEHAAAIPGLRNFNPWVFQKLSRGAMMQTAIENFIRNANRFGEEGAYRQTAKEYNEVFGNLANQSIFKNKAYQDLVRAVALAPNWAESQLRAELRGYGQLARAPLDVARGRGIGTVAQGQMTAILGLIAANQVINMALNGGKTTFQNADGHKLDAFIPGGRRGFWFNPFEIGAEYAFMAKRYFSEHMTPMDVVSQIAENKLGLIGRSAKDLLSGRNYAGQKFSTTGDRVTAALTDLIPTPLPMTSVLERDPRQGFHVEQATVPFTNTQVPIPLPAGFRLSRRPGSIEKQLLQSVGMKVSPQFSPRAEMFALAYPYRGDQSYRDNVPEYSELRTALDNGDHQSAADEMRLLVKRGHTLDQILKSTPPAPEKFTGTTAAEHDFKSHLTDEQLATYKEAQEDHKHVARELTRMVHELRPELNEASRANAKKKRQPAQP